MERSIVQVDYDNAETDIDIERNCFTFIEEQRESDNLDETETNVTDSFSESSDVEEMHQIRVKSGKTNEVNRPVWLKENQSGNKLKLRSPVNVEKERSGRVQKAKRTKNEKSCFEFLISKKKKLKTTVEFTIKIWKGQGIKVNSL